MKNFDDLNDSELIALGVAALAAYVDLECADSGVPLLPDPPVAPEKTKLQPTVPYFTVPGTNLEFKNKQEALDLRDLLNNCKSLVDVRYVNGDYTTKKLVPNPTTLYTVTDELAFDEGDADRQAETLAAHALAQKEYEAARSAYDNAVRRRKQIADPMQQRVNEAVQRERRRIAIRNQHGRYLALADGNRRTAARFLVAANADAQELCPEIFVFSQTDPPDNRKRKYFDNSEAIADGTGDNDALM